MYTVGNTISDAVDNVFLFIVIASVILLLLVTGLMIFFAIKYSRKRHPEPEQVKEHMWLEILWTAIPTVLVLFMFYFGYEGFLMMRTVPDDAMKVNVTGRMWDWSFEYENGKRSDKLYVPKDKPVKLLMKSVDVIHSFFIPAFRIKEDVVPGRETFLWFKPQALGPADIFCAEFCGQRHAYMLSQVIVMTPEEFAQWYKLEAEKVPEVVALMEELGCLDCHSLDASAGDRLSLKGIFGTVRTVLVNGDAKEVVADEDYIRRSILTPSAEILKGQDDAMVVPEDITQEQIEQIVQYLKTQKPEAPKESQTN